MLVGGSDVTIAEKVCAYKCNITLPRDEGGVHYGFLDSCGGHTKDYHYHKNLNCLYSHTAGSKHSIKVAETKSSSGSNSPPAGGGKGGKRPPPRRLTSGQGVYGKWEDYSKSLLPNLDACNGHWGRTPDSPDKDVYHYHVSDHAPFTIGCYGPNDDNSHVTVQQCRDVYDECSETDALELFTVKENNGAIKTFPYQPWCPCWDKSKAGPDGMGLNVGKVLSTYAYASNQIFIIPSLTTYISCFAGSRSWKVRQYSAGAYSDASTGTFTTLSAYSNGISIADIDINTTVPPKIDEMITSAAGTKTYSLVLTCLCLLLSALSQ